MSNNTQEQKRYIVFMGESPTQQIKCYNLLKLAYGEDFVNYSGLQGVVVSDSQPFICVDRINLIISRCPASSFTPNNDEYIKKLPEFCRELNGVINKIPVKFTVGTYTAVVKKDFVTVGCQKIPFEQVEHVYETMLKLR